MPPRRRLIYEELLVLQLGIGRMKNRGAAATGAPMQLADPSLFWASLPFSPTGAQRRAVSEILADMAGETSIEPPFAGRCGQRQNAGGGCRHLGLASERGIRPRCWPRQKFWPPSTPKA